MTLEEKCSLLSGADFWHTKAVERLGIPAMMMSDGPHGLRKQDQTGDHLGINDSIKALDAVHQKAEALDGQEQANVYAHEVVTAMDTLRASVDAMEEIVAADYWPVPTYDDILFYV